MGGEKRMEWKRGEGLEAAAEDSSTMRNRWSYAFNNTVRVNVCSLKTLLQTRLNDQSWSLLFFGSDDNTLRFSFLHSDLFCKAYPLSPLLLWSILPSLRPCSGFHRGECVWDGIAGGPTGKEGFSLARKNQLTVVKCGVECYETISWQAVFSPTHLEAKSHSLKPHIQRWWHPWLLLMPLTQLGLYLAPVCKLLLHNWLAGALFLTGLHNLFYKKQGFRVWLRVTTQRTWSVFCSKRINILSTC